MHDANDEFATQAWFNALVKGYPTHPAYGIDYSKTVDCPIVTGVVYCDRSVLLVQRGDNVAEYPGVWSLIGGFMTMPSAAKEILTELREEVGIGARYVHSVHVARRRLRLDPEMRTDAEFSAPYRRRWFEFRTAVQLQEPVDPVTNWENRAAQWVPIDKAITLPMLRASKRTLSAWYRIALQSL